MLTAALQTQVPQKVRRTMKTIRISEELFERLKTFVVDPFDDTPDAVIGRLADIAAKAKIRWSPLDAYDASKDNKAQVKASRPMVTEPAEEEGVVVL
jgi:hypothetical protein